MVLLAGCEHRVCRKLPALADQTGTCGGLTQLRPLLAWRFEGTVAACEEAMDGACNDEDRQRLWGFVTCLAKLPACRAEDITGFLEARARCEFPAHRVSPSCLAAWGGPMLAP